MIELKKIENRSVIDSVDLFNALGREKKRHYMWVRQRIKNNMAIDSPRDYFIVNIKHGKGGARCHAFMSPELAMSICVWEGTAVAKKLRIFIRELIRKD